MQNQQICEAFNAAAREEVALFPDRIALKNLVVFSPDGPVYLGRDVRGDFDDTEEGQELSAEVAQHVRQIIVDRNAEIVGSVNAFINMLARDFPLIGVNSLADEVYYRRYFSDNYPVTMEYYALFWHEMGHLLVPGGYGSRYSGHMKEAVADAYAVLRCLQRFGQTDILDTLATDGAARAVTNDGVYATLGVVDRVRFLADKIDIAALSPEDTVALAGEIAREYRLDGRQLGPVAKFFSLLRQRWDEDENSSAEEMAQYAVSLMMQRPGRHDVYRIGRHFLRRIDPDFDACLNDPQECYLSAAAADFIRRQDAKVEPNMAVALDRRRNRASGLAR